MIFELAVNGVGLPPPNVIVPAAFENVGSVVHKEKTEPVLPTLTTDKSAGSNFKAASTAFTFSLVGMARTVTVKVWPTPYEPVLGVSERSAALAKKNGTQKNTPT